MPMPPPRLCRFGEQLMCAVKVFVKRISVQFKWEVKEAGMTEFFGSQHSTGGQMHWFGSVIRGVPQQDIFHISLDNWNDGNGAYRHDSHHIYGNGGGDIYSFEDLNLLGNRTTGRLDTYDPTRDVIRISGVDIGDLSHLPATIAGVRVSVVSYLDQQWLRLQTGTASAFFCLEAARLSANVNADLGDWTNIVERHFSDLTRAQIDALPVVQYENPNNFAPAEYYADREHRLHAVLGDTEMVTGTSGDDYVFAVKYSNMPMDGMGDMVMPDERGSQVIDVGAGDDVVQANTGDDTVYGGEGNDVLAGGVDNDWLSGDSGNDTLFGGDQNDQLFGGSGDDLLEGGRHDDWLDGGGGADWLDGGSGNDTLVGGGGADTMMGGDGNDTLYGHAGRDVLDGGYGNDYLRGDTGDDWLEGGAGNDTLFGGDGNDTLAGGPGLDRVFGGVGNDFINAGLGNDMIVGGAGADRFYHGIGTPQGSDWVQDYSAAEGDVLIYGDANARLSQFQVNFAQTDNAGEAGVDEAFVIYRPTGQILWALVDGAAQDHIWLQLGGVGYDLLA